jgi:hypothetical protein
MSENLQESPEEIERYLRAANIEEAATKVLIEAWLLMRDGVMDPRTRLSDAILDLRGALSPNAVTEPDWLPEELRTNPDA